MVHTGVGDGVSVRDACSHRTGARRHRRLMVFFPWCRCIFIEHFLAHFVDKSVRHKQYFVDMYIVEV